MSGLALMPAAGPERRAAGNIFIVTASGRMFCTASGLKTVKLNPSDKVLGSNDIVEIVDFVEDPDDPFGMRAVYRTADQATELKKPTSELILHEYMRRKRAASVCRAGSPAYVSIHVHAKVVSQQIDHLAQANIVCTSQEEPAGSSQLVRSVMQVLDESDATCVEMKNHGCIAAASSAREAARQILVAHLEALSLAFSHINTNKIFIYFRNIVSNTNSFYHYCSNIEQVDNLFDLIEEFNKWCIPSTRFVGALRKVFPPSVRRPPRYSDQPAVPPDDTHPDEYRTHIRPNLSPRQIRLLEVLGRKTDRRRGRTATAKYRAAQRAFYRACKASREKGQPYI
jgi:ribulose-5-phosphate 4-epimerase/fuculose-1-phosphate aldolase